MSLVGTRIGHILIEEQIGRGGMGEVYRGFDEALHRKVAVKAIRAEHRMSSESRARFLREARLLSRLDHPSICRVYELVSGDEVDYLVLEYIEGTTLRRLDSMTLSLDAKLRVIEQVAEALAAAHAERIVHRDLKPENVMITPAGAVKVLDFGIARSVGRGGVAGGETRPPAGWRLMAAAEGPSPDNGPAIPSVQAPPAGPLTFETTAGLVAGTIGFMSPEQARGEAITEASDLYSLGVVLQEVVTDRPAYEATNDADLLLQVAAGATVAVVGVDPQLAGLIADLEALEPARRPTAAETAKRLRWILDAPARSRRRRLGIALGVIVGTALLVAAGFAVVSRVQARRQAALAQRFGQQVERVEGLLWREESLERHDMRPARRRVRERLAAIEDEMRRAGHIAEAPGHAALGRGFLALGELEEARRHLEAAWGGGFRTPDAAYALGLTLGQLYQRELVGLNRIANREEREARRKAIEAELKEPALGYLRASGGAEGVAPEYVRALLAFYEGHHREAISEAQAAFSAVPWLWEAKVVEGNALLRLGRESYASGAYDEALGLYEKARNTFGVAAKIGESAQPPAAALCNVGRTTLMLEVWGQGRGSEGTLAETERACTAALEIDADDPQVHVLLAESYLSWGQHLLGRGLDPLATIEKGIAAASRAVELAPRDDMARRTLGLLWWQRGNGEGSRGKDATFSLQEAARHARAAVDLSPRNAYALSDLGLVYQNLGRDELVSSRDPRGSLRESIRYFEAAVEVEPRTVEVNASLAGSCGLLAQYLAQRLNEDPSAVVAKGLAAVKRVTDANPTYTLAIKNRGSLKLELARWELLRGGTRAGILAEAIGDFTSVIDAVSDDAETHAFLAAAYLVEARLNRRGSAGAQESLERARTALGRARALEPTSPWLRVVEEDLAALPR